MADLGPASVWVSCAGMSCTFNPATRSKGDRYSWEFGDGMQSSEATPSHLYPSPEDYKVNFTQTTDRGQRRSIFSLEVGTANKPCSDCQAAQGVIADGEKITLPAFSTGGERDIMAWLRGKSNSYHRTVLQQQQDGRWQSVGQSIGDDDDQILIANDRPAGTYRFVLSSGSDGERFQVWTRAQ